MNKKSSSIQILYIGEGSKNNPVNSLGGKVRTRLLNQLKEACANESIKAIVITGRGQRFFSAGADIREFQKSKSDIDGTEGDVPSLVDVCNFIEASPKPIVAGVRGFALGGGMEISLACDYRVSDRSAKFGLPEVNIGLIPGAGGTQRLPRLTNVEFALNMICSGRMVGLKEGCKVGLIDGTPKSNESLIDCAIRWATWAAQFPNMSHRKLFSQRVSSEKNPNASGAFLAAICDEAAGKLPAVKAGGEAKQAAVKAIRTACISKDLHAGCAVEEEIFFDLLMNSSQGRARRHVFFSERSSQQRSVYQQNYSVPKVVDVGMEDVGVIGAGTMGTGIAISFLRAGYPRVFLLDVNEKGLARGTSIVTKAIQGDVRKRRMKPDVAQEIIQQRLRPTQSYDDLSSCGIVIEAVFENMKLKKTVFSTLDKKVIKKDALLLSNTSTLDVDAIAETLPPSRRQYCLGMHFFSPAHVMKLVEIVRSKHTSDHTVALVRAHSKKIKKIGVVVNNCDGFVGNRMLRSYATESMLVLEDGGCDVASIDKAIVDFGVALGPFQMADLAGNDISYLIKKERRSRNLLYERESNLGDELVEKFNRVGQKAMKGWYNYDARLGRLPLPSEEVSKFVSDYRVSKGIVPLSHVPDHVIVERVIYPLINEGFKILEENIAYHPNDIDIIYIYGYGWPAWRGGPMFFADQSVGLPKLLSKLEEFYRTYPGSDYFKPSTLLQTCVSKGIGVQEYYNQKASMKSKL